MWANASRVHRPGSISKYKEKTDNEKLTEECNRLWLLKCRLIKYYILRCHLHLMIYTFSSEF